MTLRGECNRCGMCCTAEHEGRVIVCEHLALNGVPLGEPQATMCRAYDRRVDGMPIAMLDPTTRAFVGPATCGKGSEIEQLVIIMRGLGRGCSLRLEEVA